MASDDAELVYYVAQELEILLPSQGEDARDRLEERARRDYSRKSPEERKEIVELYVKLGEERLMLEETRDSFERQFVDNEMVVYIEASPKDCDAKLVDQYFKLLGSWCSDLDKYRQTLQRIQAIYFRDRVSQHHLEFIQREIDQADTARNLLQNNIEDVFERYTARSSGSIMNSVGQVLRRLVISQQPEHIPQSPTTKFLRQPLDPDYFDPQEDWRGVQKFGDSMSTGVGIWLRYDRNENVIDRIVRKDLQLDAARWRRPQDWYGNADDLNHRIPMEFWLQHRCATASDTHFVRMRTYHQDHERHVVSLYNEYCPHQDLWEVFAHYKKLGLRTGEDHMLPEPALWFIFQRLVEQCLVMQQGSIDKAKSEWLQVVHCDIKPPNVFLDFPDKSEFPNYPTPKLADFGLAIETHGDDNPLAVGGTSPYRAPEQLTYRKAPGPWAKGWPLLHYTDIYAIGTVLYTLMCADEDIARWPQPRFESLDQKWAMTEAAEEEYSDVLIHLVLSCLEWLPRKRPNPKELLADIKATMNNIGGHVGEGLRRARSGREPSQQWYPELWYPEEEYKLGFVRAAEIASEAEYATAGIQASRSDSSSEKRMIPIAKRARERMLLSGSSAASGRVQKTPRPGRRPSPGFSFAPSQ